MSDYQTFAKNSESDKLNRQIIEKKTFLDYLAIALATWGVGFIPLAPGTWGSAVGVLIYIVFARVDAFWSAHFIAAGFSGAQADALIRGRRQSRFRDFGRSRRAGRRSPDRRRCGRPDKDRMRV